MTDSPPYDPTFIALQEALAGRYSLERELGRGGMGIVYLALDVRLDRPVALKLLPPEMVQDGSLRERFLREARTAAKLSHPNIVPIHSVEEVGAFVFFVMSFIEGETLGERVRRKGPVHPRDAARILREISWALSYAHAQDVIHRDIKPDNILLEAASGRALVTDFGIAHVARTAAGDEVVGTPEYMSPEQAAGDAVDGRSDIYALGLVGHYILSGELPFRGSTPQETLARQLTEPAPALVQVAPELPGSLGRAIDRCLEKRPEDRPHDAEVLGGELSVVLRDRREIPAAVRVFADQLREASSALSVITMMILMTIGGATAIATEMDMALLEALISIVLPTMLWLFVPSGILGVIARRLVKAGYDHDEMVLALEQEVEDRRNALSQQAGVHSSRLDAWARGFAFSGTFLGVLAVFSILFAPFDQIGLYFWSLFIPGAVLAMGGSITAAIREALRAVPGERWLRFWDSHPGKALYHLSGIGVERNRPALGGVYRPTELAIGMAADRLYAALPADVREDLGDVPGVVETLEGHAEQMRKRIRHLDSGLSEAAGEDTLGGDLRETRAAAEARLSEVVAALERIRLELLRLHAGAGSVEGLTVDLSHARGLSLDIGHRVEGQRAVAELLDEDADWDTPVPA